MDEDDGAAGEAPHEDVTLRRGPTDPSLLALIERLATVPYSTGEELRIELQQPPNGPPVVACRVWGKYENGYSPGRGRGWSVRGHELVAVIMGLVKGLDRLREWERRA